MRLATVIGAVLLGLGTATSASAADMPLKAPAPAYVPPAYNWTGFYLGLNVGGGWTSGGDFGDASGIIGGGQIGYNWQSVGSPFVIGLEADIQGADLSNSATALGVTVDGRLNAFGTVRGRLGYAWDRFMIYATGGWAVTRTQLDATNGLVSVSNHDWSSGWTAGGGIEWGFADRWSAKVEYLFVNTGDIDMTLAGIPVGGNFDFNVARFGINYRF